MESHLTLLHDHTCSANAYVTARTSGTHEVVADASSSFTGAGNHGEEEVEVEEECAVCSAVLYEEEEEEAGVVAEVPARRDTVCVLSASWIC